MKINKLLISTSLGLALIDVHLEKPLNYDD